MIRANRGAGRGDVLDDIDLWELEQFATGACRCRKIHRRCSRRLADRSFASARVTTERIAEASKYAKRRDT